MFNKSVAYFNLLRSGITLIETLLYVSLFSMLLLALSQFVILSLQNGTRSQVVFEVESQGLRAAHFMTQTIRSASSIQSLATSTSSSSLTLFMASSSLSPMIFSLSGGVLRVSEASGSFVALTSSYVVISDLVFLNASRANTSGIISFSFRVSSFNPGGRPERDYSKLFIGSAALRR